jgi:hypothetical protein
MPELCQVPWSSTASWAPVFKQACLQVGMHHKGSGKQVVKEESTACARYLHTMAKGKMTGCGRCKPLALTTECGCCSVDVLP